MSTGLVDNEIEKICADYQIPAHNNDKFNKNRYINHSILKNTNNFVVFNNGGIQQWAGFRYHFLFLFLADFFISGTAKDAHDN
jgi:hypothetical protein